LSDLTSKTKSFIEDRISEKGWNEDFTVDEYANDPLLWGTAGSVLYDRKEELKGLTDEARVVKAKNTKWAAAAVIKPERVSRSIRSRTTQYAKAITKRETKKSRQVIASDLDTYWKQDYLSESALDNILAGSEKSTLWMGSRKVGKFWEKMRTRQGKVLLPLDQSQFDRNQNRDMIAAVLRGIYIACEDHASKEWLGVFRLAMLSIKSGYVLAAGKRIPYKNGVLSGWRWTAMIDTLLNYAVSEVALDRLGVFFRENTYQGDDVDGVFSNMRDAYGYWKKINDWHFEVNPFKFFASYSRTEFLRRYKSGEMISGYPARSVNSILWRNPINMPLSPGIDRLTEVNAQWSMYFGRLGYVMDTYPWYVVADMSKANELSYQVVSEWLSSPRSWGGGSMSGSGLKGVLVEASKPKSKIKIISSVPGIEKVSDNLGNLVPSLSSPGSVVRKWWKATVSWNKMHYTRAEWEYIKVKPMIRLSGQRAPLPPSSIRDLPRIQRQYFSTFREAGIEWMKEHYPQWWKGAPNSIRLSAILQEPIFSVGSVAGVDTSWLAQVLGDLKDTALGTLYSLRIKSNTALKQIQQAVDVKVSSAVVRAFGKGQYVTS
jgi:hypothetical protein